MRQSEPATYPSERRRRRRGLIAVGLAALFAVAVVTFVADRGALPTAADTAARTISEVQGTGAESPLVGSVVTVEGVVTADLRAGGFAGFYVQTAGSGGESDATPGASDAVFVYLGSGADPASTGATLGDLVRVTGPVSEHQGLTEITAATPGAIDVVPSGGVTPAATDLPDTAIDAEREALEGMLVHPAGTFRVSDSHELDQFGSLWLTAGPETPVTGTEQARPGPLAAAASEKNRARRLVLDDGSSARLNQGDEQPYFSGATVVRAGDTIVWPAQAWVLSYGFDDWRLQPATPIEVAGDPAPPTFAQTNPRPLGPPSVGGSVRAATFNVQNYFTTLSSDNPQARGAATPAQFRVQKSKIVSAINGLGADVVCLLEIENSIRLGEPIDTAVADLVGGLNAALGTPTWAFVPTPESLHDAAHTDFITTALIYKADAVTPVGPSVTRLPAAGLENTRAPIAQTFQMSDRTVTVVANHFKSKSGDGPDPSDGQGHSSAERVRQSRSLVALVGELQSASGSPDVLMLGDFNAYAEEDPILVLSEAGFVDLLHDLAPGEYTYLYDGEMGSLDHALATPSLAAAVSGAAVWSINSAEWAGRGYASGLADPASPFRSSDHDPVLVGISP
ncbi:ExeM/NucH family extracellular endonuclease [Cryobacterium roopkundense]|uniref:Putative extracellular nuclease n=1 Tax=Cryobacterium roopkundense TaxID=1001240 RepID=A0A7W8ZZ22_9MICO|nr:ExeM/NucH family extracellular endonuclease [Cryobacterium roopkundense]MBB5642821.1 putative extracellular nuclease [Cryobacterium roopkundense]